MREGTLLRRLSPFVGSLSRTPRARFTLSPLGLCVLALCVIALVVPRPEQDGIDPRPMIGVALVLTLVADAVFARRARVGRTDVIHPSVLRVGQAANLTVHSQRATWGWPRIRLLGTHELPNGRADIPLSAHARGVYRLSDARLELSGPFGMVRAVVPEAHQVERVVCIGPVRLGKSVVPFEAQTLGTTNDEPDRLRPYAIGDDVRRIEWRASARGNDLLVVQPQRTGVAASVAVDLGPISGDKAERFASIAATLLAELMTRGPVELTSRDFDGVATRLLTSDRHIDVALGSAIVGEPVPVGTQQIYVGAWRPDLDELRTRGVVVFSDESLLAYTDGAAPDSAAPGSAISNQQDANASHDDPFR